MPSGYIVDIHDVHSGFDVCRHPTFHEVHDDLSSRGWSDVANTDKYARVHDHDRQAFARKLQHFLFGQIFGSFVITDHLIERDGSLFGTESATERKANRTDRTTIYNPLNPHVARDFQ